MTSLQVLPGLSPTTKSCSSAAAATEEPKVEGKVHNSREGPVETAAAVSTFSPNPSSGDQELSAILLLRRFASQARAKDCRCHGQQGRQGRGASSWHLWPSLGVDGYLPRSQTLSTIIKPSWKYETLFSCSFFLSFPFLQFRSCTFLVVHWNHNNDHL